MVPSPHQALQALPSMPYDNCVDIFFWLLTWEGLCRWHLTGLREEIIALPMTPCLVDQLCDSVVFDGWTDSWRLQVGGGGAWDTGRGLCIHFT